SRETSATATTAAAFRTLTSSATWKSNCGKALLVNRIVDRRWRLRPLRLRRLQLTGHRPVDEQSDGDHHHADVQHDLEFLVVRGDCLRRDEGLLTARTRDRLGGSFVLH